MLKRKFADFRDVKEITDREFGKISITDNDEFTVAGITKIKSANKTSEENKILDEGNYWLTLYPKSENYAVIAIYDEKLELLEFGFDIAKKVKSKPRVPYIKDLYLDIKLTPENEVVFLGENELETALTENKMSKSDYELAKKTADKVIYKYHNEQNFNQLKEITKKYTLQASGELEKRV